MIELNLSFRKYIGLVAVISSIVLVIGISIGGYGILTRLFTDINKPIFSGYSAAVYHYQHDKIKNESDYEVVVIGDSSAGGTIDASHFSALLGKKTLNLWSSGTSGFMSAVSYLRAAVKEKKLKHVILMTRVLDMAKPFQGENFLYAMDIESAFTERRFADLTLLVDGFIRRSLDINSLNVGYRLLKTDIPAYKEIDFAKHDFYPLPPLTKGLVRFKFKRISDRSLDRYRMLALLSIGDICKSKNLTCVYAPSPVFNSECDINRNVLTSVNERMSFAGFTPVTKTPVCMDVNRFHPNIVHGATGNGADLISLDHKKYVTEYYYNLIDLLQR